MTEESKNVTYCGFVAIVGRPNVGKSTLLNCILNRKVSITSNKPQTTRHKILGIKTKDNIQTVYVDTPGLHKVTPRAINRYMNRTVNQAIQDVDVIVFVVDCRTWTDEDEMVLDKLQHVTCPVILVVNKIDLLQDKKELLPLLATYTKRYAFAAIVPLAALKGDNTENLEKEIEKFLPECVHYFPEGEYTDKSMRFLVSEIVREKIMRNLEEEVPYSTSVVIERYEDEGRLVRIAALIYVEREGQKAIVIGEKGQMLKKIGQSARVEIERLTRKKVFLHLWVKVKGNWSDDEAQLKNLGYSLE